MSTLATGRRFEYALVRVFVPSMHDSRDPDQGHVMMLELDVYMPYICYLSNIYNARGTSWNDVGSENEPCPNLWITITMRAIG